MKATIVAVLAFVAIVAGQDLCNNLVLGQAGQNIAVNAKPSDLVACYQQIPLNLAKATELIAILKQLASLYAFTEYACASIPPYNTNLCIVDEITRIEANLNVQGNFYQSDYDFHNDVAVTFNRLNDAHTTYTPPAGFSLCQINRQYTVEIAQQGDTGFFRGLFGFNSAFDGAQVLTIDGLTPLQYFKEKADVLGVFRDPNVRFNGAISRFFAESVDVFHLLDIADTEVVVISQGGQTQSLTFSKNVTCIGDRTSTAKIINLNLGNKRAFEFPSLQFSNPEIHKDPLKKMREIQQMLKTNVSQSFESKILNSFQAPKMTERSSNLRAAAIAAPLQGDGALLSVTRVTSDGSFIEIRYKGLTVWKVTTFLPLDPNEFLQAAIDSIADAKSRGDKNLLIDVSGNGGGSVCLNMILASLLIKGWGGLPALGVTVPWNFIDVKKNAFMDDWVNDGSVAGLFANFLDPVNGNELSEGNWYNSATVQKNIGGANTDFTKKGYWPSPCGTGLPVSDYFFDSIFIITDGTCGSACSQFESHLQIQNGVFVMTYGGFPNGIPDTSSFAGGNVLNWANVFEETKLTTNPVTQLTTSATLTFNHHIAYQNANDANPREFSRLDSDLHSFLYSPLLINSLQDQDPIIQELSNIYETAGVGFGLIQPASAALFVPSIFVVMIAVLALLF